MNHSKLKKGTKQPISVNNNEVPRAEKEKKKKNIKRKKKATKYPLVFTGISVFGHPKASFVCDSTKVSAADSQLTSRQEIDSSAHLDK